MLDGKSEMKFISWRKRLAIGAGGVLLVLFGVGAFYIWPLIPTEVSGLYLFGLETSFLAPVEYPDEAWWVEPVEEIAEQIGALVPDEDPNDWYEVEAFVRIRGRRTPKLQGVYGHLGMSDRDVHVTQIVEARVVTEEDRRRLGLTNDAVQE